MPDFTASPLVDALEENLFSLLEKLAAEVNTEALPLIDLSSGSPDQPTPPEVIDSLQSAIHRRENHGYPSFWGKPQVREAIAQFYRRQYDVELDPHSEVAVFQGSHIGIGGIPRALLSPGNTSSPPIPAIRFTARRRCSPRRRFMACRSGRRTISCRILTIFPGKSLTRPGW
ncbi:LL-diaminopimelate aminotransferase [Serratia liquefaciens]|nr:LL-diaminopimelate aminotransferase [Serratia liquefaciens]